MAKTVVVPADVYLAVLTRDTWKTLRDEVVLNRPIHFNRRRRHTETIVENRSGDITELTRDYPSIEGLFRILREEVERRSGLLGPVRINISIETDCEDPGWKEIVVKVSTNRDVEHAEAIEIWNDLEEAIRPKWEGLLAKIQEEVAEAPIEITNQNICIALDW